MNLITGAGAIKCINCLENEMVSLVHLAAVALIFVTGFNPESLCSLECTGHRAERWQRKWSLRKPVV